MKKNKYNKTSQERNIAIIGASYLQLPLIEKAKELGYITHVFAWQANDVGETSADFFYPISIRDVDEIANKCKEIGICGICSIATDLGNYTVNYVANKLGLPSNSMECTLNSTNKYLMRSIFEKNGDPSPKFVRVSNMEDLNNLALKYPLIVKPTDRSGSRGVAIANDKTELCEATQKAIQEGFEKKAIIEEYVEGKEYSVEGISYMGNHRILTVTEKHTTGKPNFIETGHNEPANIDDKTYQKIVKIVLHALESLGIENSASHSEIKIDDNGNIKIIEIGSRMGGDCIGSDLVCYSTGIDYLKATIQVACGEEPDLSTNDHGIPCEIRYILTEGDLVEYKRILESEPDRILRIVDESKFHLVGNTTDSSNRAGCYIISNC